jgi:membrane-bound lytic murein transglycosylase D
MAIRPGFVALVACFLGFLQPSASWSADAAPDIPQSGSLEFSAVTRSDDAIRPALTPELKNEPAPTIEDSSVWVPPDFDPWAHAFAESSRLQSRTAIVVYDPASNQQQVKFFVDRFTTSRRDVVGLWFQRSPQYLSMILPVFRSRGLPDELAYTAMIESGFNPRAVSRVGAKGLWQFMAPTARLYGLRVDRWVDERLDPEKSTVAAASYLRDLHTRYGSWELAQAAYNAGAVKVDRAIRQTGSTDFWTLAKTKLLKRETKDFVPAIHATVVIGRDPSQYGFESSGATAWPEFDLVTVPPGTDLKKVAAASGISLQELRGLNPTLIRGITPPGKPWEVRVPAGTRESIVAALTPPPPKKKAVQVAATGRRSSGSAEVHVVRPRDTVASIAKQYGVSVGNVVRWNNLDRGDAIRPGDRLRITAQSPSAEPAQGGFR